MANLIDVSDIELAHNTTVSAGNRPQVEYLIGVVSAYIESYTGINFSSVVDEIRRCQADGWGQIDFTDVDSVSNVYEWGTTSPVEYTFDGMNRIWGLNSYQTVDVVLSYGWDYVPEDIRGIVVDLVSAGSGIAPGAQNGLLMNRVGDVEREYGVLPGTSAVVISDLQAKILDSYQTGQAFTMRLGLGGP